MPESSQRHDIAEGVRAIGMGGDADEQYIDLDCPPGLPRPGDLIAGVLTGTPIPVRPANFKFMGNWRWNYDDIDTDVWAKAQPLIGERIKALYERAAIRYGSWG